MDHGLQMNLRRIAWTFEHLIRYRQHLNFLRRCQGSKNFPRFIIQQTSRLDKTLANGRIRQYIHTIRIHLLKSAINKIQRQLHTALNGFANKIKETKAACDPVVWRTFTFISRAACKEVKEALVLKLHHKFEQLCGKQLPAPGTLPPAPTKSQERYTIVGDCTLTQKQKEVLSFGPSFAPSIRITAVKLHWQEALKNTPVVETALDSLIKTSPFPGKWTKPPTRTGAIDAKIHRFRETVNTLLNHHAKQRNQSNLDKLQRRALRELREQIRNGDVHVSVSDKGGEFVACTQEFAKSLTLLHLSDETTYEKCRKSDFADAEKNLKADWKAVAKRPTSMDKTIVGKRFYHRIKNTYPSVPVMYTLVKTHKINLENITSTNTQHFKVRPIISGCDGPTDRISWVLAKILTPLLHCVTAHLESTGRLLDRLSYNLADEDLRNVVYESFDVEALYTNVNNEAAAVAIERLMTKDSTIKLYGLSREEVMYLLRSCLKCNFFSFNKQMYRQKRGLAMGNRLAPLLAIAFMDEIETHTIKRDVMFLGRYVDDIIVVAKTKDILDKVFNAANAAHATIKLTREVPINGWLPFLDMLIYISEKGVTTKWYQKAAKKPIMLPANSAHSTITKRNVVENMYHRANAASSTQFQKAAKEQATRIAKLNGYGESVPTGDAFYFHKDYPVLKIPFISDTLTKEIVDAMRDCEIPAQVLAMPPPTLRKQLTKSRLFDKGCRCRNCRICENVNDGTCQKKGAVYLITCLRCSQEYVGETSRPLCIRNNEHHGDMTHLLRDKPWSRHIDECYRWSGEQPNVKTEVLALETNLLRRKVLEAMFIKQRKPTINVKKEMAEALQFIG
jgi:hypothetical protein